MTRQKRSNDHSRSPEVLNALTRRELEFDPLIDAWDKQPAESPRNFGLFAVYRDTGRLRSVAQVAGMTDAISYASIARIARSNKWVERAGQWDAEMDRIAGIRLQDAREEMARRHAGVARKMMEKALARLETLDVYSISPNALILMLAEAAKIERAALGLETLNKGATSGQTVTVATKTDASTGTSEVRVEVGARHDQIMHTLDEMVKRMSPEQITAGYEELTASAEEALRGIDAALPTPPPS